MHTFAVRLPPRLRLVLIALLLLLALALLFAWMRRAEPHPTAADEAPRGGAGEAVPVVLAAATEAVDDAALEVLGSGVAQRSVTLYPAVAGEVATLSFRPGQRVQAGQALLRLVDRRERLAVDLAAARLQAA